MNSPMNRNRVLRIFTSVSFLAALCVYLTAAARESFDVRLSPAPRDAAMRATIAGSGSVKATLAGHELTIDGTFTGFVSPATRAAIHRGPAVGMRGPAVYELTVSRGTSGTVSGTITLNDAALEALSSGQLYLQIAAEGAPDGNVWGWLLPAAVPIVRDR
jgi:hypothetical protein